jgi:YfiH family protein
MLVPAGPDAGLLTSPALARLPRLASGFTTRRAGSAAAPGEREEDDAVAKALGTDGTDGTPWRRHAARQVHGARCVVVEPESGTFHGDADALLTRARGELLVVRTADCVPILAAAVGRGGVEGAAAIHAGWRGLLAGVVEAAVAGLRGLAPGGRLVAALGPAIGPCCFEVGEDVAEPLAAAYGASVVRRSGTTARPHADLPAAVRIALAAAGASVPDRQPPPCTRCEPELFHSHRAAGTAAGRMGAFIGIA